MDNLETTNWLLGVVAVAGVVQTLLLIGLAVAGFRLYRQVGDVAQTIETRHVEPLRRQVDGVLTQMDEVLSEVQEITARISQRTERVDHAISGAIERVDETAEHLAHRVRDKVAQATGVVRGIRAAVASVLTTGPAAKPPAQAGGQL
jgi:uncharacterized protein YoxC